MEERINQLEKQLSDLVFGLTGKFIRLEADILAMKETLLYLSTVVDDLDMKDVISDFSRSVERHKAELKSVHESLVSGVVN